MIKISMKIDFTRKFLSTTLEKIKTELLRNSVQKSYEIILSIPKSCRRKLFPKRGRGGIPPLNPPSAAPERSGFFSK